MFCDIFRSTTFVTILVTSLIWVIVDLIFIAHLTFKRSELQYDSMTYKDGTIQFLFSSDNANKIIVEDSDESGKLETQVERTVEIETISKDDQTVDNDENNNENLVPLTYEADELKDWKPALPVQKIKDKPGEMGLGITITPEMEEAIQYKFSDHAFNILASDMISLTRSLPDVRSYDCQIENYAVKLPTSSVIIIFHNEAWSTLLRTVWSVINRTPSTLLKEIILVDDASEQDYLGKDLDEYVSRLPVHVILLRSKERIGLIQARLLGAEISTGEILTFLDAHCECTEGWLEPILFRISQNRLTVVSPVIDIISERTFAYKEVSSQKGSFDLKLNFRWDDFHGNEFNYMKSDSNLFLRTPIMAGGIFSIDKKYFYEIGSYDKEMKIWGGENLEISLRIWQCGGLLEISKCSHVGHVFRRSSPYSFPDGVGKTISHNLGRIIEVWMDEWKDLFRAFNPNSNPGDVSERIALRERLHCKSFKWYLENIFPDDRIPMQYYNVGRIHNLETKTCLDTMYGKAGDEISIASCHENGGNQIFVYTNDHELMTSDLMCLDASYYNGSINLYKCHKLGGNQEWIYNNNTILHIITEQCLTALVDNGKTDLILRDCENLITQRWIISSTIKL